MMKNYKDEEQLVQDIWGVDKENDKIEIEESSGRTKNERRERDKEQEVERGS